jgi:hypothetical protein
VGETYVKVRWMYLYRAVDRLTRTIDFLRSAERDAEGAKRLIRKLALLRHCESCGRPHRFQGNRTARPRHFPFARLGRTTDAPWTSVPPFLDVRAAVPNEMLLGCLSPSLSGHSVCQR